jgi:hypothetical protein
MFVTIVHPVYDRREEERIAQPECWLSGLSPRSRSDEKSGVSRVALPSAFRTGLVEPRHERPWYAWPNESFIAQMRSQARLVDAPTVCVEGARAQARVRRTYTFCRSHLALYVFQFELPNSLSPKRKNLEDAASQLLRLRVKFALGDREPIVMPLSESGPALCALHCRATTARGSSFDIANVQTGQPIVSVLVDKLEKSDWGAELGDCSVAGLLVAGWPTTIPIPHLSLAAMPDAQAGRLRGKAGWKRTSFGQSYAVGHLVEGPVLADAIERIGKRKFFAGANADKLAMKRLDASVSALSRARRVLPRMGRDQIRDVIGQVTKIDIEMGITSARARVNALPARRYETLVALQDKLRELDR